MKVNQGTLQSSLEITKIFRALSRAQLLFLISVLLIPVQLNKFFFNEHSFVIGIPIDYLAPAVYLSDIFIISSIIITVLTQRKKLSKFISINRLYTLALVTLLSYLTINAIVFSKATLTSLTFTLKLLEISLFSIVALYHLEDIRVNKVFTSILKFSAIWLGALALLQFLLQRSLNLYFLGERSFDVSSSQIATVNILGNEVLRSYATFPHPNILAAFLIMVLIISQPKIKAANLSFDNIFILFALLGILTTFSKTAFILIVFLPLLYTRNYKIRFTSLLAGIIFFTVYFKYFSQNYIDSIAERILLSQIAIDLAFLNPLFGVGSANFISNLASFNILSIGQVRLLQPVHNVFLLTLTENGLIGLLLFSFFVFTVVNKTSNLKAAMLSIFLISYLLIDHFFWTLHQGRLIFFLTTAILYSSKK